jgi:hypothetical protein
VIDVELKVVGKVGAFSLGRKPRLSLLKYVLGVTLFRSVTSLGRSL